MGKTRAECSQNAYIIYTSHASAFLSHWIQILANSSPKSDIKKKKKKKKTRPCFFAFYGRSGEGNITIFFFWPNVCVGGGGEGSLLTPYILYTCMYTRVSIHSMLHVHVLYINSMFYHGTALSINSSLQIEISAMNWIDILKGQNAWLIKDGWSSHTLLQLALRKILQAIWLQN